MCRLTCWGFVCGHLLRDARLKPQWDTPDTTEIRFPHTNIITKRDGETYDKCQYRGSPRCLYEQALPRRPIKIMSQSPWRCAKCVFSHVAAHREHFDQGWRNCKACEEAGAYFNITFYYVGFEEERSQRQHARSFGPGFDPQFEDFPPVMPHQGPGPHGHGFMSPRMHRRHSMGGPPPWAPPHHMPYPGGHGHYPGAGPMHDPYYAPPSPPRRHPGVFEPEHPHGPGHGAHGRPRAHHHPEHFPREAYEPMPREPRVRFAEQPIYHEPGRRRSSTGYRESERHHSSHHYNDEVSPSSEYDEAPRRKHRRFFRARVYRDER